jgi:hypothetical protein
MRHINEHVVLLRARQEMPASLKLTLDEFGEGWNFVRSSAPRLERKVQRFGWHLIRTEDESRQGGVGATAQEAISRALELALRRTNQYFNGLEIGRIHIATYPWFVLARLGLSLFRIQQDPVQALAEDALVPLLSTRRKAMPANTPWLSPAFQCDAGSHAGPA